MKVHALLAILVFSSVSYAKNTVAKASVSCGKRALQNKDCHIRTGKIRVHLFKDKIIVIDDVYRGMADMPVSGEQVIWHKAEIKNWMGRTFLDVELWAPPAGEVGVQSLGWYVYEIKKGEPIGLLPRTVQKRREVSEEKKKFKFDKVVPHKIFEKNKKVFWQYDGETAEMKQDKEHK